MPEHSPARADPVPLSDPPFIVFAYTAWVLADAMLGRTAGLTTLVGAVAALAAASLRGTEPHRTPSFVVDFATILLCCAGGIGAGVLVLHVVT